jgi:two-component system response regulator
MELLSRDSLRIVHVDDDHDFVELNERSLKCAGFKKPVVRCADGYKAINYFLAIEPENAPHVVLVDLHMPRMSGLGVLHWLRTNYTEREIAVFLVTSSVDPSITCRRAADGGVEYVPKGGILDYLLQKLDDLIASKNEEASKKAGNGTTVSNFSTRSEHEGEQA